MTNWKTKNGKKEPFIRCDKCRKSHYETSIYDASKVHLTYKDLCISCINSNEDIELVVDEDSGFIKLMTKEDIEKYLENF